MMKKLLAILICAIILTTTLVAITNVVAKKDEGKIYEKILIYSTEDGDWDYDKNVFDNDLPKALKNEKFKVKVTDRIETPFLTNKLLKKYDQLWLLCSDYEALDPLVIGDFTTNEINDILNFRKAGNGLLIMTDHYEFTLDANQISIPLGVNFSGVVYHGSSGIDPFIVDHPLAEDVASIWGSNTEANLLVTDSKVKVIAKHNGENMIAVLDDGYGRVVFDTSFTRFLDQHKLSNEGPANLKFGDDEQYAINIANWLSGKTSDLPKCERYEMEWLKPLAKKNEFKAKDKIYIKFTVNDKDSGMFIEDKTVFIDIFDEDNNNVAHFEYGKGKDHIKIKENKHYKVKWDTKKLKPGDYTIVVDFEDYCGQVEKEVVLR